MTTKNKFPYQVIFYKSEEAKNSPAPAIEGSQTYDHEPTEAELDADMLQYKSTYCECYFDITDDERYNDMVFSQTPD